MNDYKENVKIEQLCVTNRDVYGLLCEETFDVDVMECGFKQCQYSGMYAHSDSYTVTATRCGFLENGQCGVACAHTDTIQ